MDVPLIGRGKSFFIIKNNIKNGPSSVAVRNLNFSVKRVTIKRKW